MPTVFIPQTLRRFTDGRERVDVSGATLRQVIDQLESVCPGIKAQLVEDDALRPGLAVAIDNELAAQGLIQRLDADAEVRILPAIGGGALTSEERQSMAAGPSTIDLTDVRSGDLQVAIRRTSRF